MASSRLPNCDQAVVPLRKVNDYLLSLAHPDGGAKAQFFMRFGFRPDAPGTLASALLRHARQNRVVNKRRTPFGVKYVVEGPLISPDGRNPAVRSIWFIAEGDDVPQLVTAYPRR